MKEAFTDWNPTAESLGLLITINEVLTDYAHQGYRLTLRQLYYQLVARDVVPNNLRSYHAVGRVVSQGRLAGLIDWSMIEDRVRVPVANAHWESPAQILKAAASSYYRDRWAEQNVHVEVWCEKDAVSNIIEPVCRKWDVLFLANRGYSSQSAMYQGCCRIRRAYQDGKAVHIVYLGDHDPSGIDMTRDIEDRLGLMVEGKDLSFDGVKRIALTMEQIEQYSPPENPAKETDSRYNGYTARFGESSWELDALEPSVLAGLVEGTITEYADPKAFQRVAKTERQHQAQIRKAARALAGGEGAKDA